MRAPNIPGYLRSFAIAATVTLILAASLNYYADPAGIFRRDFLFEAQIAAQLSAGKNVAVGGNFNDRLLQKFRCEHMTASHADVLVIGSSRTMQVSRSAVGDRSLANLSVTSAVIQDDIVLWEMGRKLQPATVVLGVDPWVFNRYNGQDQWEELQDVLNEGLLRLIPSNDMSAKSVATSSHLGKAKLLQLINFDYTWSSWKKLKEHPKEKGEIIVRENTDPDPRLDIITTDGDRVYNSQVSNRGIDAVRLDALDAARNRTYLLRNYYAVDRDYLTLLRYLLQDIRNQARLVIILTPFHPDTWGRLKEDVPLVITAETQIRKLAADLNVPVIGSYDPYAAGCGVSEFVDGIHPKPSCIRRLLAPAFAKIESSKVIPHPGMAPVMH